MPKKIKEDIQKSIDNLVDEALSTEETTEKEEVKAEITTEEKVEETKEDLTKAEKPSEHEEANSGEPGKPADKIKSGSPMSAKQSEKKKIKKSLEELAEHLDEAELGLIEMWRNDQEEEEKPAEVKTEDITKSVEGLLKSHTEELRKVITERDSKIDSLSKKVEKLSTQPAYDKRGIENLETLEKSEGDSNTPTLNKAQVLDKMLELQQEGKGVNSRHIAEFEVTQNISDPNIKRLVMESLKSK